MNMPLQDYVPYRHINTVQLCLRRRQCSRVGHRANDSPISWMAMIAKSIVTIRQSSVVCECAVRPAIVLQQVGMFLSNAALGHELPFSMGCRSEFTNV
jgi:hypothetical protein